MVSSADDDVSWLWFGYLLEQAVHVACWGFLHTCVSKEKERLPPKPKKMPVTVGNVTVNPPPPAKAGPLPANMCLTHVGSCVVLEVDSCLHPVLFQIPVWTCS